MIEIEITCNDIFCPVNYLGTKLKNSVSCEACMRLKLEDEIEKIKKEVKGGEEQ